jgi:hypothetical protein
VEDAGRWVQLDEHLPPDLRDDLERRFWRPIEARAKLEALVDDPSFYDDPGRHPAMFADHGVVHVRDVAGGLVHLIDTVDGVLLPARPGARRRFMATLGVALAYLHDVGMVDMSPVGRRVHPLYAAHAAFWPDAAPLVDHLLAPGPIRSRLDEVATRDPFDAPIDVVARELLSLGAAHSKTTIPAALLDDRAALAAEMRRIVATSLDEHRAAAAVQLGVAAPPPVGDREPSLLTLAEPAHAYAWLAREGGAQGELVDDVIDTIRVLRAADVLRQRGTALRTSGGYEICFDARTARAVCTLRAAGGDAAYVITYDDLRGGGEANIRVAYVTSRGHLRVAFHSGGFSDGGDAVRRAAASVANAIVDIQSDVLPSFEGRLAHDLPPPARRAGEMRIQLEQPGDAPTFADGVAAVLAALEPRLDGRIEVVANLEDAAPEERARYLAAEPIDGASDLAVEVLERLDAHGAGTAGLDASRAFREVVRATVQPREILVAAGSPPSFVYVPMGPGLVVLPGGGYAPSALSPWVPVATTGVIRGAERNSEVVAVQAVDVVIIPGERYATNWLRPLGPAQLRALLGSRVPAA